MQIVQPTFESSPLSQSPGRRLPNVRREGVFPYQAHQPRRSLSSALGSSAVPVPQPSSWRPRRPSLSGDSTPLSKASLVGSYEESILRGRMSTTPSRPLNFVAKIGVLGKGKCKPSLRCPRHVSIPFPAVFYSYSSSTGTGSLLGDQPSPYVGCIDLENSLPPAKDRRRKRDVSPNGGGTEGIIVDKMDLESDELRPKRRSREIRTPPGGSYRIPQVGQIQVVIQNPNKTAVKLFLVPYDLTDMQPGQKTFIRQRLYSAGPLFPTLPVQVEPPTLRYLIHLQICCTGKGRFYLYNSIRVVFANRVPDGKEKLKNETKFPEPKYGPYKPSLRRSASNLSTSSIPHDAWKRTNFGGVHPSLSSFGSADVIDGIAPMQSHNSSPIIAASLPRVIKPIPFNMSRLEPVISRPGSRDDKMDVDPPAEADGDVAATMVDDLGEPGPTVETCDFSPMSTGYRSPKYPGTGLLARKLRGLDVDEGSSDGLAHRE
jgi:hypothetical protein